MELYPVFHSWIFGLLTTHILSAAMKLVRLAMAIAQVSTVANATTTNQLDGWYPCAKFTESAYGPSTGQIAECAIYMAPLCYPGICDSSESEDSTIDVFVKRIPAVGANTDKAANDWLLEGGPGWL